MKELAEEKNRQYNDRVFIYTLDIYERCFYYNNNNVTMKLII